mgnify:CR=1 FL=1
MRETFNCSVLIKDVLTVQSNIIVISANPSLLAGSGISGIIHKAAGPQLEAAAKPFTQLTPGQGTIALVFKLSAKHSVHMAYQRF